MRRPNHMLDPLAHHAAAAAAAAAATATAAAAAAAAGLRLLRIQKRYREGRNGIAAVDAPDVHTASVVTKREQGAR